MVMNYSEGAVPFGGRKQEVLEITPGGHRCIPIFIYMGRLMEAESIQSLSVTVRIIAKWVHPIIGGETEGWRASAIRYRQLVVIGRR